MDLNELKKSLDSGAKEFATRPGQRLQENGTAKNFLDWLLRYDAFNRGFPGAAAQLAGRITEMVDHFGDIEAERIASRVLAAITDEFLDRSTGAITLHSALRRELVIFSWVNLSSQSRQEALQVVKTYDPLRKEVLRATRIGYGLETTNPFSGVFAGLGFFAASETSGSTEFVTLNRYMNTTWPDLKTAMQEATDDQGRALYAWVVDHQDLEADHAAFAFSSIELAVQYLGSDEERTAALAEVNKGIQEFFAMADRILLC